jgi:hypothetical protein
VIITSTQQSVTQLGAGVPVEVFTEPEALAYKEEALGVVGEPDEEGVIIAPEHCDHTSGHLPSRS